MADNTEKETSGRGIVEIAQERRLKERRSNCDCPHEKLIEQLLTGFPGGVDSHRVYHQAVIDGERAQEKFWNDLSSDLKKKGIYAIFLVLIGLAIVKIFGPEELKMLIKFF